RGHSDTVGSVAWSPDGTHLASASNDGIVKVWDADQKDEPLPLLAPNPGGDFAMWALACSPNGKHLASVGGVHDRVWDVTAGKEFLSLKGDSGNRSSGVAWNPDGTRLAYWRMASPKAAQTPLAITVKILEATTGREVGALKVDV